MRHSLPPALTAELGRKRLVTLILNLTEGTLLELNSKERTLLEKYVRGEVTLDEMLACLPPPEFTETPHGGASPFAPPKT